MLTVEQAPKTLSGHCGLDKSTQVLSRSRQIQKCAAHERRTRTWSSKESSDVLRIKREKNRLAATKCRERRKKDNCALYEKIHAVMMANKLMKEEVRSLRNQLSNLRMLALKHSMCEFSCDCNAIQKYNANRAFMAALGAGSSDNWEKFKSLPTSVETASPNRKGLQATEGGAFWVFLQTP
jgi:hypothetical protein